MHSREGDITARLRIIQTAVRVFFYDPHKCLIHEMTAVCGDIGHCNKA